MPRGRPPATARAAERSACPLLRRRSFAVLPGPPIFAARRLEHVVLEVLVDDRADEGDVEVLCRLHALVAQEEAHHGERLGVLPQDVGGREVAEEGRVHLNPPPVPDSLHYLPPHRPLLLYTPPITPEPPPFRPLAPPATPT